jgi:hypothetical protein
MVNELKNDMQWNNGVFIGNFTSGKNAFVARHNLPITTRKITRPSLEDIREALENGDAIEISTTMTRSASGQANTGHVMTGVAAFSDGGQSGIGVHDPATPEGAEMYELTESGGANPYLLIDYPLWDGIMFIDTIFVQTWTESPTNATTNDSSTSMVSPEIAGIEYAQLHTDSNVFPHKYSLTATVYSISNPTYAWVTSCGYFIGSTDSNVVEWWYDSWACGDTLMTLTVTNDNGLYDSFEYMPW